ncbi:MAG: DUF4920 domain-containing protein [Bacteroidota bacterium]
MRNFIPFIFLLLLAACAGETTTQDSTAQKAETTEEEKPANSFGELIDEKDAITLAELPAQLESADSVRVKLSGTVESVCQVKGCWMNIVSKDAEGQEVFVKFKDYGFFVPVDIAGKTVVMDGYAFKEMTSVDELRHYAEDEGQSEEQIAAITEPVEELKFMASGVLIVD